MAGNCNPPYCGLGTGGWCNCNCKCCIPCPCYLDYYWTSTVTRGMPCSDASQTVTSNLSFEGCCLRLNNYSSSGSILKYWSFNAIGAGTISITNAYTEFGVFCGYDDPSLKAGLKFGINANYLTDPGTLSYEANNCELIGITLVLDVNPCCGYSLDSFGGNQHSSCGQSVPLNLLKTNILKRQVLSRIKKVHYK